MGQIDFLIAKARARSIKGTKPTFKKRTVYLPNAFHPLLDKETVVSNTIEFIDDVETVIITGPNTGGKTVTLKTLDCHGTIWFINHAAFKYFRKCILRYRR